MSAAAGVSSTGVGRDRGPAADGSCCGGTRRAQHALWRECPAVRCRGQLGVDVLVDTTNVQDVIAHVAAENPLGSTARTGTFGHTHSPECAPAHSQNQTPALKRQPRGLPRQLRRGQSGSLLVLSCRRSTFTPSGKQRTHTYLEIDPGQKGPVGSQRNDREPRGANALVFSAVAPSNAFDLIGHRFPRHLRNNGLFLACMALFAVFFLGMIISGWQVYNQEQLDHGSTEQVSVFGYLQTGDFLEATFENWESEFLQMAMYVVLTAYLYQRGSSESKPVCGHAGQDDDPRAREDDPKAPWPVRRGGIVLTLYENSLAAAFFLLFFACLALHAWGGARAYSDEQQQHGGAAVSVWRYLSTSQFWFESMQNWQSEFIAVAAIVVLSVFLRQRRSPESKPVADPHTDTGA